MNIQEGGDDTRSTDSRQADQVYRLELKKKMKLHSVQIERLMERVQKSYAKMRKQNSYHGIADW